MSNTFPVDWRSEPCFVAPISKPLIPYVAGLLKMMEQRGFWASEMDYQAGFQAVMEYERCLMALCLDVLLESNDRLYRMLDTALYGKEYTVVSSDPLEVTPGIPEAHELIFQEGFGLMFQVDKLTQLVDNSINGTITPIYSYSPDVKTLLQGVIDAITANSTDLDDILTQLETIALLVA